MRTAFRSDQLADPHIKEAEKALRTCVHCGFCTATCPTYLVLGDERDGPRGRIVLMQHMLESEAPPTAETVKHLDQCLSCLGCRTACPSGVDYSALIEKSRAHIEAHYRRPFGERLFRNFILFVLTRPKLFAALSATGRVFAPIVSRLPGKLGTMSRKAGVGARKRVPPPLTPPRVGGGVEAQRVLLLPGCVQRALAPEIDAAATRVLARQKIRVDVLPQTGCCGALAYHMGKTEAGKSAARAMIAAFERESAKGAVDAVLITASGCSAFLKEYGRVFADEPSWKTRAEAFIAKVKDFSEIARPVAVAPIADAPVIAYHPPCSLQHGQRLYGRGEALLAAAGFRLAPIPDAHLCCGSAGSYSLLQPAIADELRSRKLAAIRATGAGLLVSANIGCLTHLSGELPTAHIAELLDWAGGGPKPNIS
ncbi:MAG TPA: glycolate oxidase subunit GlcF [Micropepsaceae bacterium]|jgi:glycolate oxidase iron-sulfur subunit|nr:glycolate oxidase subunit GlcF [Micropepsaceae bacterium]